MSLAIGGWPVAGQGVDMCRPSLGRRGRMAIELVRGSNRAVTASEAAQIWGCSHFAAYQRLEEAARAGFVWRTLRRGRDSAGICRHMVHYSLPEHEVVNTRMSLVQAIQRMCARGNPKLAEATRDVLRDESTQSDSVRVLRAVVRELMEDLAEHGR